MYIDQCNVLKSTEHCNSDRWYPSPLARQQCHVQNCDADNVLYSLVNLDAEAAHQRALTWRCVCDKPPTVRPPGRRSAQDTSDSWGINMSYHLLLSSDPSIAFLFPNCAVRIVRMHDTTSYSSSSFLFFFFFLFFSLCLFVSFFVS